MGGTYLYGLYWGAPPENSVGQGRLRYRIIIGMQTKPDFQEQMKLIFYLKSILHVTSTREFWFVWLQVFSLFVQIKWGECMHASLKWLFLSLGHFARWTNEKEILLIVYWLVDFLSSPYKCDSWSSPLHACFLPPYYS